MDESYMEYLTLMHKIDKLAEQYAKKQKQKKEAERKRKKLKMIKFIQEEHEDFNEDELVYCLKRMAEY